MPRITQTRLNHLTKMDRWERMKPYIEQLWLIEKKILPELIEEMKASHDFNALYVVRTYSVSSTGMFFCLTAML